MGPSSAVRAFRLPTILPKLENVMGRLGYNPKKTRLDDVTRELILSEMDYARPHIHPAGHTRDNRIERRDNGSVFLESGIELKSSKLAGILAKAEKVTVLACTIGDELKQRFDKEAKGEQLTRAVILDAIASESVEAFADHITDILAQEYNYSGYRPTMRFSPGYGDFKTAIHSILLPFLDADKAGISSDPVTHILSPEKTISAVIGWVK